MQGTDQAIGGGGDHAAALHLTAIGADPAIPQPRQPKGGTIAAADQAPLLIEAIGGQQAAAVAPGAAEAGLLRHGFAAGVERTVGREGILAPFRQQTPEHQRRLGPAMLLAQGQHRFARGNQVARGVVPLQARRQGYPQLAAQGADGDGEAEATTHGWTRLERGQTRIQPSRSPARAAVRFSPFQGGSAGGRAT